MEDTTALTIVTEESYQPSRALTAAYPGMELADSATQKERERFIITASRYTGGDTVGVEDYLTRTVRGVRTEQIITVRGCLAYLKEMTNQETGEVSETVGVVFRIEDDETGEEKFLSFTSRAAWNFVKRSILPLRPMGDWQTPLYMIVRAKPLQVGRTYLFQLVEVEEEE